MNTCTWVKCDNRAVHDQVGRDGDVWACLCNEHQIELQTAMRSGPQQVCSAWVKAQGGARAATDRMAPQIVIGTRLLDLLRKAGTGNE